MFRDEGQSSSGDIASRTAGHKAEEIGGWARVQLHRAVVASASASTR
jgi:hypothetical protein